MSPLLRDTAIKGSDSMAGPAVLFLGQLIFVSVNTICLERRIARISV